jgi:putative restriction endonuclease
MATGSIKGTRWTRDELILAFNLYCRTSFGRIHNKNPEIIELAKALGRTPSAVSWKLANFARLDPTLAGRNIKGASHGSKEEVQIWEEFQGNWEKLTFESEKLRLGKEILADTIESEPEEDLESDPVFPEGKTRESSVRLRVNQGFFRRAVLAAYQNCCCITGIGLPDLLCASHIIPWSVDIKNRTNPSNGLCLNAIHDRAFDRGLLTITEDFRVKLSPRLNKLKGKPARAILLDFEGCQIKLPKHFQPRLEFLKYHNEHVFKG